jgi:hypothetical protein
MPHLDFRVPLGGEEAAIQQCSQRSHSRNSEQAM